MVRITDIQDNSIMWNDVPYCQIDDTKIPQYMLHKGDILFARTGSTVGKSILIKDAPFDAVFAGYLVRTQCVSNILPQFAKCFLESSVYWNQLKSGMTATAQPNFNGEKLSSMIFPLPPLAEQKRIVAKVEELFAYADQIGSASEEITKTAQRLDKKILDLAIRGKLVPQDPNDEPASELVKRIEAARNEKTGSKKSRAAASHKPTYEIEPPFDIPESWEWVRLGEVLLPMTTKHPTGETFKYIDIDAIDNKANTVLAPKFLSVEKAPSRASRGLQTGDTLFSVVRPYLRNIAYISNSLADCIASTGFYVCRPSEVVNSLFLFKLLLSDYVVNGLNAFMKGDNSPSIRVDQLNDFPIPLPPLAEQKRIVKKIDELKEMTQALVAL